MSQEDKLKTTLREYYDTQETPFHDEEWDRASAYLKAARRKKRIRRVASLLSILLCAGWLVLYNSSPSTRHKTHPVSLTSEQLLKPASLPKEPTAPTSGLIEPNTIVYSASHKGSVPAKYRTISSAETKRKSSATQVALSSNDVPQVPEAKAAEVAQDFIGQGHEVKKTSERSGNLIPSAQSKTGSDHGTDRDIGREVGANSKDHVEIVSGRTENSAPDENHSLAIETPQLPLDSLPQSTAPIHLAGNKKEISAATVPNPAETILPSVADASSSAQITDTSSAAENAAPDTLSMPTVLTSLSPEGIFYEAGAVWLYGWKGPVHRDARGFSPLAGINYMNRLSNRCALSFGVQYLMVPNLSNSSKTSYVSSYIYGEQSKVTVITPSTLHYLLVPLRFHYHVDAHNCFGGGLNLAYLLNVDAAVTSYDEGAGYKRNYKTIKQGGYTEGFSWFDCQLALFYRRKIIGPLALQAEIFLGLTDVKQDEFFGLNHKERNSGVKLSLIYFAFRKNGRP